MDNYLLRESVAAIAILISIIAKWRLGSMHKDGWIWAIASGLLWLVFAGAVHSPMSILNSIIMVILSIRGWMIWSKR